MSEINRQVFMLGTRVDPETGRQLKVIAAEEGITMQQLIAEGVHFVLTRRRREPTEILKRLANVA